MVGGRGQPRGRAQYDRNVVVYWTLVHLDVGGNVVHLHELVHCPSSRRTNRSRLAPPVGIMWITREEVALLGLLIMVFGWFVQRWAND